MSTDSFFASHFLWDGDRANKIIQLYVPISRIEKKKRGGGEGEGRGRREKKKKTNREREEGPKKGKAEGRREREIKSRACSFQRISDRGFMRHELIGAYLRAFLALRKSCV
jgi:hypothetical protein